MFYQKFILFGSLILLVGCIPSLHEGYTSQTATYEERLIGVWNQDKAVWVFKPADVETTQQDGSKQTVKGYLLEHTDQDGNKAESHAVLFKIGEVYYLDLEIKELYPKPNTLALFQLIPGHLILRVSDIEGDLKLAAMKPKEFKQYLDQNPDQLSYIRRNKSFFLTAKTAEIQKFLQQEEVVKNIFGTPMVLKKLPD